MIVRRTDVEDDDSGDDASTPTLVVWEMSITISRPRLRFANPVVMISTSTVVKAGTSTSHEANDAFLPSFVPLPANLLEPLRGLPGLHNDPPYLAASRLDRMVPRTSASESIIRIPQVEFNSIRVMPALIANIRTSRPNPGFGDGTTIVSLEIELVPFIAIKASLEKLDLSLDAGEIQSMMPTVLPMSLQSNDSFAFIYKLHPSDTQAISGGTSPHQSHSEAKNIVVLSTLLQMIVHLSSTCTPTINMNWTTEVDISSARTPQPGSALHITPPLHRDPSTTNPAQPTSTPANKNIKLTFSAPTEPGRPGIPITWKVHIDNQTPHPVKLSLIPLPRLQRHLPPSGRSRHHAPQTSSTISIGRHTSASTSESPANIAQAVIDENVLYTTHHSRPRATDSDLLSLTPEVRVGPLGPGACHEAEMKLVALRRGVLAIDCVRVVDLSEAPLKSVGERSHTGDGGRTIDITDLPVVRVE